MRRLITPFHFLTLISTLFALVLFSGFCPGWAQDTEPVDPTYMFMFEFQKSPDNLVLQMTRDIPLLANQDPTPVLRIYGNGDVRVHRPDYLKTRGDYYMKLSPNQLYGLLGSLAKNRIFEFDREFLKQKKQQIERERAEQARRNPGKALIHGYADPDIITIEIFLDRYFPSDPNRAVLENVRKKIQWEGIYWDARLFPEIESLQKLAEAERLLEELVNHGNLKRLSHE